MINPSYTYVTQSSDLVIQTPMALLNLPDKKFNFCDLPFLPPEYLVENQIKNESLLFTLAAILAFFYYDTVVFDISKYQSLLDENYTTEQVKKLVKGGNLTYFQKSLVFFSQARKNLMFAKPSQSVAEFLTERKNSGQKSFFLMSFSLFAAEFDQLLATISQVQTNFSNSNLFAD